MVVSVAASRPTPAALEAAVRARNWEAADRILIRLLAARRLTMASRETGPFARWAFEIDIGRITAAHPAGGTEATRALLPLLARRLRGETIGNIDRGMQALVAFGPPAWTRALFRALAGAEATVTRGLLPLFALMEAGAEPVASDEAVAIVVATEQSAPALTGDWWMAVYARLFRQRLIMAAWAAKAAAARVELTDARAVGLDTANVARAAAAAGYLRDEPALLDILGWAEAVLDPGSRAAIRLSRDILIALGRLDEARHLYRGAWRPADHAFAERVAGRSIALVGPAPNTLGNGPAIDAHDLVARTNLVTPAAIARAATMSGSRTDISYYNIAFARSRMPALIELLAAEPGITAVFKAQDAVAVVAARRTASGGGTGTGGGERAYWPSRLVHRGAGFALRHVIPDLLMFAPAALGVFGSDFFLGRFTHAAGYFNADATTHTERTHQAGEYVSHDVLDSWHSMKRWRDLGWFGADAVLSKVLDLDEPGFAEALADRDRRFGEG